MKTPESRHRAPDAEGWATLRIGGAEVLVGAGVFGGGGAPEGDGVAADGVTLEVVVGLQALER